MLFQRGRHVVLKSFLQENLALDKTLGLGKSKQRNLKLKFNIQPSRLQKLFLIQTIQPFLIVVALTFTTISYPANAAEPTAVGQGNNSLTFAPSTADSRSQYLELSPGINFGSSQFTFETYFKTGSVLDNGFFLGVGSGNGLSINI